MHIICRLFAYYLQKLQIICILFEYFLHICAYLSLFIAYFAYQVFVFCIFRIFIHVAYFAKKKCLGWATALLAYLICNVHIFCIFLCMFCPAANLHILQNVLMFRKDSQSSMTHHSPLHMFCSALCQLWLPTL